MFGKCLGVIAVLLLTASALAAADSKPIVSAYSLATKPILDGSITGDPAWTEVKPASGFTQVRPTAGAAATEVTQVYIGVTEDTLYIGVICLDDEPDKLIISDARRDADLGEVDSFLVIIDAFQDRQNGVIFGTTPGGLEYDAQVIKEGSKRFGSGGGGFNLNWDVSWQVKGSVHERGWSAEMAIPFKSLRYAGGDLQDWGINFQRNIARKDETVYWAPLPRQHNLNRVSEAGTLTGVAVPKQRNFKIAPYILGQVGQGGSADKQTRQNNEIGVDAKYSVTPSLTLDVTYNTDFAQVEVDEIQVNLDRYSIFLPEKRPFFLENAGLFSVGSPREVELFFSRRIGLGTGGVAQPIDGGLRLSGKVGSATNLGLLRMRTGEVEGDILGNNYSVARVSQELANRSSIGGIYVSRDGADYENRAYALDGRWGIGDNATVSGYYAKTDTPELRGDDAAFQLSGSYSSQSWNNSVSYSKVGEDFNPEVGFLRRRDYEKFSMMIFNRQRPEDLWGLFELRPHAYHRRYVNADGVYESGFTHIDNHWEWTSGLEIHTGFNLTHEQVLTPFEINSGTFVPVGEYDHKETQLVLKTDKRKPLSISVESKRGGFYGGDRHAIETGLDYRFGDSLTASVSWDYNDIRLPVTRGDFKVNVGRMRLSYSFTPKVLLQALVQYDDRSDLVGLNLRFSWLQTANSGLYIVYNEVDDDMMIGAIEKSREIAIKYSRILDIL